MKTKSRIRYPRTMIAGIVFLFLLIGLLYLGRPAPTAEQHFGVTFTSRQAADLGLDPKEAYRELLDDVGVRHIRLGAYWDVIEAERGVYDFEELDWQINEAGKRGAAVVLAVGRKLPRWPECFHPEWIHDLNQAQYEESVVRMVKTVATRYWNNPTVSMWQLENEPFVGWFGECPPPNPGLLRRERDAIRSISDKPIIITDSGELSVWHRAARFGEVFGTTMYRVTWNPKWGYGHLPVPALWYRLRARFWGLEPKDVLIMELQAEPWPPGTSLAQTSIEEQLKSMNIDQFRENVALARATGFGDTYLWGAEWWLWMKNQGHPEFWEAARELLR